MNTFQTIVEGVICSLAASFLFIFFLLYFLKPKFVIYPNICLRDNKYWFKIVNKSIYHAFDVKIELTIMTPLNHSGAKNNLNIIPVTLRTSNLTSINRNRKKHHNKDPFSLYAFTLFTEHDLDTPLTDQQSYLELRITARHGLSGLADRFVQQFPNQDVLFKGHNFCIANNNGVEK
jgi:hypothetical protein